MKKMLALSVELQSDQDFSRLPGAAEFEAEYKEFEQDDGSYVFDLDGNDWTRAERDLKRAGLRYGKGFKLRLDEAEIAGHPVHYLTIPALYDLVKGKKQAPKLSAEVARYPIAQDFKTEVVVARDELVSELNRLNPKPRAKLEAVFTIKKKKYRILAEPPQLDAPMLIDFATAVAENEGDSHGTYYLEGWDGRSSLSQGTVNIVLSEHLVAARVFEFQGRQYRQNAPNYLLSGQFAAFLNRKFKALQIAPMTFDLVS
jgi:hypothetical protein